MITLKYMFHAMAFFYVDLISYFFGVTYRGDCAVIDSLIRE